MGDASTKYALLLDTAQTLKTHMASYGYEVMETPVIDRADLFLTKAGDQIIEKLFTFERSGRQLALRPEFTAGAAHQYSKRDDQSIVRWQFQGMIFEDHAENHIQQNQHFSIGAELIGNSSVAADAEIIAMATHGINQLSREDWTLKIGHAGLMRHLLAGYKLDNHTQQFILSRRHWLREGNRQALEDAINGYIQPALDTEMPDITEEFSTHHMLSTMLDATQRNQTMGGRTREDIARRLIRKRQQASQYKQIQAAISSLETLEELQGSPDEIFQILAQLSADDDTQQLITAWQSLVDLLIAYDIPTEKITIQPDLVRDWDYYTGIVFEIRTSYGEKLCSGGRYDELAGLIGGETVPAVGFAYFAENIAFDSIEIQEPIYLYAEDDAHGAIWSSQLRQKGLIVILDFDVQSSGSKHIIINENNQAVFGQSHYALSETEALITEINNLDG